METADSLTLLFAAVVPVGIIVVFIRITMRVRRGGGSLTIVVLGATDEFLTRDRSKAAETIVNGNAGKKLEDPNIKESK
jgi:hypothetical protein